MGHGRQVAVDRPHLCYYLPSMTSYFVLIASSRPLKQRCALLPQTGKVWYLHFTFQQQRNFTFASVHCRNSTWGLRSPSLPWRDPVLSSLLHMPKGSVLCPSRVKRYKTSHCFALKKLRQRLWAPTRGLRPPVGVAPPLVESLVWNLVKFRRIARQRWLFYYCILLE